MSVLLLRLAGPMQSWGTQSRFSMRDTGLEPSKSGVVGLLCAALGRPRDAPLDDLASLRMGVRVDREGCIARDYQTALGVAKADGSPPGTVQSWRYYLADADFLVGVQGPLDALEHLHVALAAPRWPLFLGRKAHVPGEPVHLPDGLQRSADLEAALAAYPWRPPPRDPPERIRVAVDSDDPGAGATRNDVPLSFANRRFAVRYVATRWLETSSLPRREEAA